MAGANLCGTGQAGENSSATAIEEFAQLDKDVVLSGNINRIEIWSKEKWAENNAYDDMDDIAEQMTDLGLSI